MPARIRPVSDLKNEWKGKVAAVTDRPQTAQGEGRSKRSMGDLGAKKAFSLNGAAFSGRTNSKGTMDESGTLP